MGTKVNPNTITGGHGAVNDLNTNFTLVADEFDNCLSLDGSTPNSMTADIDLNNNDLINVNVVDATQVQVGGQALVPSSVVAIDTASSVPNVPAGNISSNDVQAAINELDTEKAGLALANTFTANNTFSGTSNNFSNILNASGIIQSRDETMQPAVTSGTNTYTAAIGGVALGAYSTSFTYKVRIGTTNTGASTLNLDSVGAASIVTLAGDPLLSGMLQANKIHHFAYDGTNFILIDPHIKLHGVSVSRSSVQSIPDATTTTINFSSITTDYDTDSFTDVGNNRFNIPSGVNKIRASFYGLFAASATGVRLFNIEKNGTAVSSQYMTNAGGSFGTGCTITSPILSVVGGTDYIDFSVYQNSGGALNLSGATVAVEVIE